MSNDVVYEHPDHPVDEQAEFLRLNSRHRPVWAAFSDEPVATEGFAPSFYRRYMTRNAFAHQGPRYYRIVRLSDPAYYCAENPYTTADGLLGGNYLVRPPWLHPSQHVRAWVWGGDGCTHCQERLAGVVDWKRVNAMKVLTPKPRPSQDAAMLDAIAKEFVKNILGLRGASTEDIFRIVPDPKPKLHRTNKFRQRRRVLARGPVGLRDTVLQQYWESEDGEHGEWRDVPVVVEGHDDV